MPRPLLRRLTSLLALLGLVAGACGDSSDRAADTADPTSGAPAEAGAESVEEATVLVFAAASLTDALDDVAEAFETAHPGLTVELNVSGSSALREQILAGAPADVFASANTSNMDSVVSEGAAADPEIFATNHLQIVVPAGNPGGVSGLADLARDELLIGLCAADVPCGELARQALAAAGVEPAQDTDEPDVRALLTKVAEGELDAGIVYTTDVIAEGDAVEGIAIPAEHDVVTEYPIAVLTDAPEPDAAAAFVAFVLSDAGQAILASYGFGNP